MGPSKAAPSKANLTPEGLAKAYGDGERQPRSANELTTAPIVPTTFLQRVLHLPPPPLVPSPASTEAAAPEELLAAAASERTSRAARAHVRAMPDFAEPSAHLNTS